MPKDRAEVQDQYKIGGGFLNEYEFDQSKGDMEEQSQQTPEGATTEGLRGAAEPNAPQSMAQRIRQVEERAREIVERRSVKGGGAKKATGKVAAKSAGKGVAKSAKKTAQKSGTAGGAKQQAAAKGGAKGASKKAAAKGASKKGGAAKKGAAKKGGGSRR